MEGLVGQVSSQSRPSTSVGVGKITLCLTVVKREK